MNAIAAPKSSAQNRLEGFALTFLLQGFPTFAGAALLLKLAHHEIAGGVVLFVVLASCSTACSRPGSRRNFQILQAGYEPLFFNAGLSFVEKRSRSGGPADDVASTGDERAVAVAAGGGRDE